MDWQTLNEILNKQEYIKAMVIPTAGMLFGGTLFLIGYGGYKLFSKLYDKVADYKNTINYNN